MVKETTRKMTKFYISWDEFHTDVKTLCAKLKTRKTFKRIIAVARGGLIPAGIVAYELDIRHCEAVNMCSYDHDSRRDDNEVKLDIRLTDVDADTLFIDDLSDSGRTVQILWQLYPQACFATVYTKPSGQSAPDVYARALPDEWVVFPWDVD